MRKIIHHLQCTVDWCDRNQYAHGLCGSHYQRLRAGRDMNKPFQTHKRHGETNTLLHRAWIAMRARCNNPNNMSYKNYGGRGITVYEGWQNDFKAFHEYVGDRPSKKHTLDRIDVNGNYEPGNVRWVTWDIQASNKRKRKSSLV